MPRSARNRDSAPIAELREGKDWIRADEWGATKTAGIYAGGDDLELALVATAVYQGRMAAQAIEAHVRGGDLTRPEAPPPATKVIVDWHMETDRHERQRLPIEQRDLDAEIEQSLLRTMPSRKRNAACPAACAWIVKAAGCIAPTTASSGSRKGSITASRWISATAARNAPKAALPDISNSSKFPVEAYLVILSPFLLQQKGTV